VKAKAGLTEIVSTGEASWAERNLAMLDADGKASLDPEDLQGPVPVGVAGRPAIQTNADAAEKTSDDAKSGEAAKKDDGGRREPRLVVYGDSDFAANEFLDAYSNRNLFVNSVNWLIGDVEAISIRPNESRASRFQLSAEQFRTIRSLSLFVLPQAIA